MISFPKLALALLFSAATVVVAQTPIPTPVNNLYAIGVSYNVDGKPTIAGTAMYAHYVAAPGTYAFTVIDILPNTVKPYTVTNNIGMGLAQNMFSFGKTKLFMPTAAGISWSGPNTGWQWNGGVGLTIPIKNNWYIIPTARFVKSSVSGGTGYQPIVGIEFGFGK